MNESQIPKGLIEEYQATEYRIGESPEGFTLRIDRRSDALARLLSNSDRACALFITAYNPFSQPQCEEENKLANRFLVEDLVRQAGSVTAGIGINPVGQWPGEPGYLALGLDRETSYALGRKYRQNAGVWAAADGVPQLLLLR